MKKYPIDHLFAEKLREAEKQPKLGFEALQKRMQDRQRKAWWQQSYWWVAAGVSLLVLAGIGWYWQQRPTPDIQMAQKEPSSILKATNEAMLASTQDFTAKTKVIEAKVSQGLPLKNQFKTSMEAPTPQLIKNEIVNIEPQNQVMPTLEEVQNTTPEETKTLVADIAPQKMEVPPTSKTVILKLPDLPEPKETQVAFLEENELPKNSKNTRLAKVWKQLKNAKNGEKIDWEEVGIQPHKLMAKAGLTKSNDQ